LLNRYIVNRWIAFQQLQAVEGLKVSRRRDIVCRTRLRQSSARQDATDSPSRGCNSVLGNGVGVEWLDWGSPSSALRAPSPPMGAKDGDLGVLGGPERPNSKLQAPTSKRPSSKGARRQGLEQGAGWPGVFEKWTLLRSAYAKATTRQAEDGRTPPKGGFEVFPYWLKRIPTCVAVLADGCEPQWQIRMDTDWGGFHRRERRARRAKMGTENLPSWCSALQGAIRPNPTESNLPAESEPDGPQGAELK